MQYLIEKKKNCLALKLERDISVYEVDHFRQAFDEVKKQKDFNSRVVVDFERVGFIDALALGVLTAFSQEARGNGGDVKLSGMNDNIKNVFTVSHLSKIYDIFGSLDEAARSFR